MIDRPPASHSSRPALLAMWVCGLVAAASCAIVPGGSAFAQVAPPATPAVELACDRAVAASAATADQVQVVRATVVLAGCVADPSGIEHVTVSWERGDGRSRRHARICTDPAVIDGRWECTWHTGDLEPGRYRVELAAVDLAGNRGSFSRRYDVRPAEPARSVAPEEADPTDGGGTDAEPAAPSPATPDPPAGSQDGGPTTQPPSGPSPEATTPAQPGGVDPELTVARTPLQMLVLDRITACESGGVPGARTDDDEVVTEQAQAAAVLECMRPALLDAGAVDTRIELGTLLPATLTVLVDGSPLGIDLAAVLPPRVAGVATQLRPATAAELAELTAGRTPAAPASDG